MGLNPGMVSVDFAFNSFINRVDLKAEIDYFSSDMNYALRFDGKEINWDKLDDTTRFYEYEKIIYWGDFFQWLGFGENDWCDRQLNESKSSAMENYYRLFLLDKDEALHKKTILFGGTIYPLSVKDLLNTRYYQALKQLIENSCLTMFRDVASAGFAQQLSSTENQFWGCDCAFLLETGPKIPSMKNYLVYSFGRSGQDHIQLEFVRQLAKQLQLELIDIRWLDLRFTLATKIQIIKQASAVVTDIYHLAVTGLREHIPTLCIGHGSSYATSSLSDKKKEILFKQHFADSYYIFLDELIASVNDAQERIKQINRYSELLLSKDQITVISNMLDKHIERASNTLHNALLRA